MDNGAPLLLFNALTKDHQFLAPMPGGLVIWTPDQVANAELLAQTLGGLGLILLVLNLWVLVRLRIARADRQRNEQSLVTRIMLLEAQVARQRRDSAREPQLQVPMPEQHPGERPGRAARPDSRVAPRDRGLAAQFPPPALAVMPRPPLAGPVPVVSEA
jgi:hypothetical protein